MSDLNPSLNAIAKTNLKNRTPEERKNIARLGAIATNKKRAEKKLLRETLEEALKIPGVQENLIANLIRKGVESDQPERAFEVIRDTTGQKPVERHVIAGFSASDVEDINEMLEDL